VKLIVGLGNPGRTYAGTRHNVGFEVVDLLAERFRADWQSAPRGIEALTARDRAADTLLVKPLTFMNLSGPAVAGLAQFYKSGLPDLFVVVDDVNLELGRLRARAAGSAGGHNGLKSIIGALGSDAFARMRIGVGGGDPRRDLSGHVLGRFAPDERTIVAEAVSRSADAAELFIAEGIAPVMNRFNRKEEKEEEEKDQKEDRD
jgi:PTH1 family peptidyl-tRNA hydrolase